MVEACSCVCVVRVSLLIRVVFDQSERRWRC